jgi:hypothetical protein
MQKKQKEHIASAGNRLINITKAADAFREVGAQKIL